MKVEIISIGDELLIGQTINTNASWIGAKLSQLGARIEYGTIIRDKKEDIVRSFDTAFSRVDLIVVTGGLGPTKDDITKKVLCEYFNSKLEINAEVLAKIKEFFESRDLDMLDINIKQAEFPVKAKVLFNDHGTAPGMWFEHNGKVLISLPGVPYEMKGILSDSGFESINKFFSPESLHYETIQTQGIGESYLAERLKDIESEILDKGYGLAYLPSPGLVRMRLSSERADNQTRDIEKYVSDIERQLPQYVFGRGDVTLAEVVGDLLNDKGLKLCTIESCTGGAIAKSIISIPGSSAYFEGGVICYSNDSKVNQVKVSQDTLEKFGAVSKEVVEEMAINGRKMFNTEYSVAVSGVAGPDGGTDEMPVGTVWISISSDNNVISKMFQFGTNRNRNIEITVNAALNLLRCRILEINIEKN